MDEDWIEEDILVYVDFGKFVASSEITDPDLQFKIIDLERPKVFSEVNGKVFSGSYEESMGTLMLFAEDPDHPKTDNIFEKTADKNFVLQDVTTKSIRMKRIFVTPKEDPESESKKKSEVHSLESLQINQTYHEALDTLLKPDQMPPRIVQDVLDNRIRLQREIENDCKLEDIVYE